MALQFKHYNDKLEQTKTLTLGASAPSTVTPDSGYVLSSVPVSIDSSVIKAENIAKDVQILGITGTHEGGSGGNLPCTFTVTNNTSSSDYMTYINQNLQGVKVNGSSIIASHSTITNSAIYYYMNDYYYSKSVVGGTLFELGDGHYLIFPTSSNVTLILVASCFLPDTLITLADGTKKQIKDITYSDELRVWDFDTGTYGTASICWITKSGLHNNHYYKLTFSDGTILKTTGQNSNHKVYNVDERYFKGVNKTEIGDRIFSENGIVTVTNKEYIEEDIEYYNLITTEKINCFAEGILTSDRYGNLYPIDENMMYIKEGREIRSYSEFEAVGIKRYWYDTLRLGEVTGTVEETRDYINKLECQMLPLLEKE